MSGCDSFRPLLHDRLDGELSAGAAEALDAHLATCPDCRSLAAGLSAVRSGLLALPEHPLPPDSLEEILERTVRGPRDRVRLAARWPAWAAAAAVAALVLILLRGPLPPGPAAEPSPDDLARAAGEARAVLCLASGAIHRAERAAAERVLVGEVAPALRRIPIRWAVRPGPRKP